MFVIRKCIEHAAERLDLLQRHFFYVPSLSSRTLIFKGMLTSEQLSDYFPDLNEEDLVSALAMVHSRFSTNTFPSWDLAQPFRYLSHNGEINTLRGNINWMRARERLFACTNFTPEEMERLMPILNEEGSDSSILDNALEMLVLPNTPQFYQLGLGLVEEKSVRRVARRNQVRVGVEAKVARAPADHEFSRQDGVPSQDVAVLFAPAEDLKVGASCGP